LPPLGRAPLTVTASPPPADADVPGRSAAPALAAAALVVLVVGAAWLLTEWRREGRRAMTAPVAEGPGEAAPVAAAAAGAPAARRTAVPPERLVLNIEETVPGGRAAAPRRFGAGAETPEVVDYTVVRGDTLWAIARRFTRNPFHYREIASENDVRDPNLIVPGQQLTLRIHRLAAAPDATPR
jgi:nucleoid-associated protein YgaU